MNETGRRELTFETLEEVRADVEHLLKAGYRPVGKWNLSQVCGHLTIWMSYPIEGYPRPPFPLPMILAVMKWIYGRKMFQQLLERNCMEPGLMTLKNTIPAADAESDQLAAEKLFKMINRVSEHRGKIYPSPLFDEMTAQQMVHLQLVHCAHHLSFLIPQALD